ncbi:hypothetical protein [Devosia sp. MC521]|uniref:hypothetical protein n=1 Tax=Devosia sp. MC521 TaxID=2759954 RepID=UPI0015FA7F8D|nr:hypothetical protein [Devosia sp. MC521]MBJ6986072.1 hypothetical protein [Devosia sp. MC521]QMW61442.1 hypothetical protein H4N61_10650 [Devosia sp. MC521]
MRFVDSLRGINQERLDSIAALAWFWAQKYAETGLDLYEMESWLPQNLLFPVEIGRSIKVPQRDRSASGIVEADYHRRLDADPGASKPEYLFPQTRPRARRMAVTHIHPSTLTHNMGFMPAVTSSPHRVRSFFGTYGERVLGFARPTTKLILDHAEGGSRSDVTGRHYALHEGSHGKWPVMRKWAAAVEGDLATAVAKLEPIDEIKAVIAAARYGDEDERQAAE